MSIQYYYNNLWNLVGHPTGSACSSYDNIIELTIILIHSLIFMPSSFVHMVEAVRLTSYSDGNRKSDMLTTCKYPQIPSHLIILPGVCVATTIENKWRSMEKYYAILVTIVEITVYNSSQAEQQDQKIK